jgi:hypothetical protein
MATRNDEQTVDPGEPEVVEVMAGEAVAAAVPVAAGGSAAAATIRAARAEAERRGAPMVSAQLVQAKLFEAYDGAAAVPEALALVQRHLRLTLDRTWYSPQEIDDLADQLDWLLGLERGEPVEQDGEAQVDEPDGAVAGEAAGAAAG